MSPSVLLPEQAGRQIAAAVERRWPELVCAEATGQKAAAIECKLRPGIDSWAAAKRYVGAEEWAAWRVAWRGVEIDGLADVELDVQVVSLERVPTAVPTILRVTSVDAALTVAAQLGAASGVDLPRARSVADRLQQAGGLLTPGTLKSTCALSDGDVTVLLEVVAWLREHPDLSVWTLRQLPVPGLDTKWLAKRGLLVRDLTGRAVQAETRPRLAVTHLTYLDPQYLASGGRRHDAWTSGDSHDLAYHPRVVLVVENRDCRLWFPPFAGGVAVEGGGKAAAALLADIPWLRGADIVAYWGDMDADGYAILARFRAALAVPGGDGNPAKQVGSILMGATDLHRYAHLGVSVDKEGRPLRTSAVQLAGLTEQESLAYEIVAAGSPTPVRRIEQERIPLDDALAALRAVIEPDHRA